MPSWLKQLAPSAADCLAGKSPDEISELLDDYTAKYPPRSDFQKAIAQSVEIDNDSKEILLGLYF